MEASRGQVGMWSTAQGGIWPRTVSQEPSVFGMTMNMSPERMCEQRFAIQVRTRRKGAVRKCSDS